MPIVGLVCEPVSPQVELFYGPYACSSCSELSFLVHDHSFVVFFERRYFIVSPQVAVLAACMLLVPVVLA